MGIDLADFERKARESVMAFWGNRAAARQKQIEAGKQDQGDRAAVTGGSNMDGFLALMIDLVEANGLRSARIMRKRGLLTLPGFFRPTKLWDLLVLNENHLIAAVELKSHVGSFGNNFNNRAEEAVGTAHDLWTAYREGGFGDAPQPFAGWLMLVEDAPGSRGPIRDRSPHFPVFPEFQGASYVQRYNILCRKLVQEKLYTAACAITSPREAVKDGHYADLSETTSLRAFVAGFAGHVAAEAARTNQ